MAFPAKVFKISKKPMSDYIITPSCPGAQPYIVEIETHSPAFEPYLLMHEGTKTKDAKTLVGSVRRVPSERGFEVATGNGLQDVDDAGDLTMLRRSGAKSAELEFGTSRGQPRALAWKHKLSTRSNLLLDPARPDTPLAEFQEDKVLARGGTLTVNVDWGLGFERMAILSLMTLFEQTSAWSKTWAFKHKHMPLSHHTSHDGSGHYPQGYYVGGTHCPGAGGFFTAFDGVGGGGGGDGGGGGGGC